MAESEAWRKKTTKEIRVKRRIVTKRIAMIEGQFRTNTAKPTVDELLKGTVV